MIFKVKDLIKSIKLISLILYRKEWCLNTDVAEKFNNWVKICNLEIKYSNFMPWDSKFFKN